MIKTCNYSILRAYRDNNPAGKCKNLSQPHLAILIQLKPQYDKQVRAGCWTQWQELQWSNIEIPFLFKNGFKKYYITPTSWFPTTIVGGGGGCRPCHSKLSISLKSNHTGIAKPFILPKCQNLMSTQGVISDHKIKCQPVFFFSSYVWWNVCLISSFFELSYYCKSISAQNYPPISLWQDIAKMS